MQVTKAQISVASFGILVALVMYFAVWGINLHNSIALYVPEELHYGIMIDAGSTGTRIHIFRYGRVGADFVLQDEDFLQVKPGLSSYRSNPELAGQSLKPLLDAAVTLIPKQHYPLTPMNLLATAGLRLVSEVESQAILQSVRKTLQSYPFMFTEDDVQIIDGTNEGIYGWLTINYLQSQLKAHCDLTSAVLDLGGGSTQIAMSVNDRNLPKITIGESSYNLFSYSFLGFGLMAGRAGVIAFDIPSDHQFRKGQKQIVHQCFHPEVTVTYEYNGETFIAKGHDDHSANSCYAVTTALIRDPGNSFAQSNRKVSPQQSVYILSYYFDRAVDVGLVDKDALRGTLTVHDYWRSAQSVCGLSPHGIVDKYPLVSVQNAPFLCLDLCYIVALLEEGFALSRDRELRLSRKMEFNGIDVETSWPLGASLFELAQSIAH
jgi:Golgi nucleoside diphosphatase